MHHVPQPKDQARILQAFMAEMNISLPYQQALEATAKMMGHKNWATHSAAVETEQLVSVPTKVATPVQAELRGPSDGDVYQALVTVDQTMSALVRVKAKTQEEAKDLLCQAAAAQFPHGFKVDEGNYRGTCDFYLGDPQAVENLSKPKFDDKSDNEWAKATWQDGLYTYQIEMTRNEQECPVDWPDVRRKASVHAVLTLTRDGFSQVTTMNLLVAQDLLEYFKQTLESYEPSEIFFDMRRSWELENSRNNRN